MAQIAPLKKTIEEKTTLANAAREESAKSDGLLAAHDAVVKKWQAAAINTRLLQAQSQLADLQDELTVAKEEKPDEVPALEQKLAALTQSTQSLQAEYQAAK